MAPQWKKKKPGEVKGAWIPVPLAVWSWANCLTFLCLRFINYQVGISSLCEPSKLTMRILLLGTKGWIQGLPHSETYRNSVQRNLYYNIWASLQRQVWIVNGQLLVSIQDRFPCLALAPWRWLYWPYFSFSCCISQGNRQPVSTFYKEGG